MIKFTAVDKFVYNLLNDSQQEDRMYNRTYIIYLSSTLYYENKALVIVILNKQFTGALTLLYIKLALTVALLSRHLIN